MSGLPSGWVQTTVGSLINSIEAGKNFRCIEEPPPQGEKGVVKVSAVSWGQFQEDESKTVPPGVSVDERARIRSGDLLISRANTIELVGACVRVGEVTRELYLSDKVLRLNAMMELRPWLHRYLSSPTARRLMAEASSGNQISMRNISQAALAGLPCPLAPSREQQRIADKLDVVLAKADACRERLGRVPALLKQFRQSVLAAATSGRLTEDWREAVSVASDWPHMLLDRLVLPGRIITYGVIKLGDEIPDGTPCLRTSNVRWLRVDMEGMKRIAPSLSAEYGRTILKGGEVLVNVRGTLGGVAVVTADMAGWNVSREVAVVPVNRHLVSSEFLALWIASERTQRWLGKVEKGVAYTGINIEDLRNLPVGIPNMDEQTEIVRRVESLFGWADRLEERWKAASGRAEKLTPALLAKAFRGELVPQDPADEPADELLARLAANKGDNAASSRTKRRPDKAGKDRDGGSA